MESRKLIKWIALFALVVAAAVAWGYYLLGTTIAFT
jgi:hypothetical protein